MKHNYAHGDDKLIRNFFMPTIYPEFYEEICCLYLQHPRGGQDREEASSVFRRNIEIKQKNVIRTTLVVTTYKCSSQNVTQTQAPPIVM